MSKVFDMTAHDHEPRWNSIEKLTIQAAQVTCVAPFCGATLIVTVGENKWDEPETEENVVVVVDNYGVVEWTSNYD
jgi:hypothetical protein